MPSRITELRRPASTVARILELTLAGWPTDRIKRETRLHYVEAIQSAHGWPDHGEMRNMWLQLRLLKDLEVLFDIEPTTAPTGDRP